MLTDTAGRMLQPENVRMVQDVVRRIKSEGLLSKSPEKHEAFAGFLLQMYCRGLIFEDKLYGLGVAAAKARFHDPGPDKSAVHLPVSRVLIVEDDYYLANEVKTLFEQSGAVVLGPAANESEAMSLLQTDVPDFVILDLNLGDGIAFNMAEHLRHQAMPFCIVTAYKRSELANVPADLKNVPWLEKPTQRQALLDVAANVMT